MINNIKFNNKTFNELGIIATNSRIVPKDNIIIINCNAHLNENDDISIFIKNITNGLSYSKEIYINNNYYFYLIENITITDLDSNDYNTINFNINIETDGLYYTLEGNQWVEYEDMTPVDSEIITYNIENNTYNSSLLSFRIDFVDNTVNNFSIYMDSVTNTPLTVENYYKSTSIVIDGLLKDIYETDYNYLLSGFSNGNFLELEENKISKVLIKVDKTKIKNIYIKTNTYL